MDSWSVAGSDDVDESDDWHVKQFKQSASKVLAEFKRAIVNTSPATGANPLRAQAARRRLLRDYKEVLSCPTPGVSAAPLDDNIFQWHVNLCPVSGPYTGTTLHCVLLFDNTYPTKPPKLKLATPLWHP